MMRINLRNIYPLISLLTVTALFSAVLLLTVTTASSPLAADRQETSTNTPKAQSTIINLRITKSLSLCQEFLQILNLPENAAYLMNQSEYEDFRASIPKPAPHYFLGELRKRWKPVVTPSKF